MHVPESVLSDLRRRLSEANWPDQLPGTTWEYGADINKVQELADYWQNGYDWRAQEANRLSTPMGNKFAPNHLFGQQPLSAGHKQLLWLALYAIEVLEVVVDIAG
jgi:hypothetical protein